MEVVKGPDNGREERLIRLMEQYEQDLLRMCCAYLRDRALAQDAVQEAFLKAYKGLDSFRGDCAEKTWLTRIAINVCKTMRKNAWFRLVERRVALEDMPLPAPDTDPDHQALALEVMRLPARYREVVLLYYYQGMKVREIGEALDISAPAVSKRLKQARNKLHLAMEGGEEHE